MEELKRDASAYNVSFNCDDCGDTEAVVVEGYRAKEFHALLISKTSDWDLARISGKRVKWFFRLVGTHDEWELFNEVVR